MAATWAVGAAATLAVAAWLAAPPPAGALQPAEAAEWLLGVVALGTWAYAIAVAAHGGKGALAALLANVLAMLVVALVLIVRVGPSVAPLALLAVAAASAWAIAGEIRRRRGAIQWGAFFASSLATIALAAVLATRAMQAIAK